jgi:hypothetical protein
MQTLRFILFSFITFTIISNAQTVIPPGDVSGTWSLGGSPYEIQGEITIPDGLTLTIEPGVLVEFQGHYKFNVQGRLLAVGTETDTIVFTINDTTGFHNPDIPDGGWHSIRFIWTSPANDSSKIVYCKLQYGKAIGPGKDHSGGAICVEGFDKLTIANCLITNNIAGGIDWTAGGGIALWISSPVLIGNTISNNSASEGGGVEFYGSNATVMNNIFVNNLASAGGGLIIKDNSNIVLINDSIANNVADNGGGIISWGSSIIIMEKVDLVENTALLYSGGGVNIMESGSLTMNNCNLINNESLNGWGGGISADKCDLEIDNCSFVENKAPNGVGGAISFSADTTYSGLPYQVTINSTSFLENTAGGTGGVKINNWAWTPLIIDVTIDSCEFINNSSDNCSGLLILDCTFTLSNSVFTGNTAVVFAAAAAFSSGCIGTVSNCLFASNIASTGGGNWSGGGVSVGANVDFMNCTFADNLAYYGAGLTVGGGGIATTTNCIFWGNSTDQIALETWNNVGGTLTVNYCDVQGGEDSVKVIDPLLSTLNWGIGNKDENPLFVGTGDYPYTLLSGSPCIDAGDPNPIYNDPEDPNNPGYALWPAMGTVRNDMGAYGGPGAIIVGIEDDETKELQPPTEFELTQNYPNPFNPSTTIQYSIKEITSVKIVVYDILGRQVVVLVNEEQNAGYYKVNFNAERFASGIYFYRIQAGSPSAGSGQSFVVTKKMILMK